MTGCVPPSTGAPGGGTYLCCQAPAAPGSASLAPSSGPGGGEKSQSCGSCPSCSWASQSSTHLVLHVRGSLQALWGALHASLRAMHSSWGALHPVVIWHVAVCPGRGPHHPTLNVLDHAPLMRRSLRISSTHSSWMGGALHPSRDHAVRPLWAHVPGGARVSLHTLKSLHVWWSHHAPRVGPHLSRHEGRLHVPRSHGGAHLLRWHVQRKALLTRGAPGPSSSREG